MPAKAQLLDAELQARLGAVGDGLRARRKALGVNVVAAAEAAGISRVTWYRLEKGEPAVTLGVYAKAAQVLGLQWPSVPEDPQPVTPAPEAGDWIPVEIRVGDYPQLGRIAWQLKGRTHLGAREALGIYERNWRHVDQAAMSEQERALIDGLRKVFAGGPDV